MNQNNGCLETQVCVGGKLTAPQSLFMILSEARSKIGFLNLMRPQFLQFKPHAAATGSVSISHRENLVPASLLGTLTRPFLQHSADSLHPWQ